LPSSGSGAWLGQGEEDIWDILFDTNAATHRLNRRKSKDYSVQATRAQEEAKPPFSRACPGGIDTFHHVVEAERCKLVVQPNVSDYIKTKKYRITLDIITSMENY
jgi:hypothetical protein